MSNGPLRAMKTLTAGEGRTRVELFIYRSGASLLAVVCGEGHHLGAATLAQWKSPDPIHVQSLHGKGHKDHHLTDLLAPELARCSQRDCLCTGGIHLDDITSEEIQAILDNANQLVQRLRSMSESARGQPQSEAAHLTPEPPPKPSSEKKIT